MNTVSFLNTECNLSRAKYSGGNIALYLTDESGFKVANCTVNLDESLGLKENQVFIRDYAENAGMLKALVAAGVVEDVGESITYDYSGAHTVVFPIAKIINTEGK
tara:strand:+ start:467 stop:781 length:315 start_codon:yes stop_codon:yes gene_type:complete